MWTGLGRDSLFLFYLASVEGSWNGGREPLPRSLLKLVLAENSSVVDVEQRT